MAMERINPFEKEDRFCLDHLLRYHWASFLTVGKRVLDIACGTGFGSEMLARSGAEKVMGVDIDEQAIQHCRDIWSHANLDFATGSIEDLPKQEKQPWDVVACFETLEHVRDPDLALRSVKDALKQNGLLIGSVPGEMDRLENNEYHLQYFSARELKEKLGQSFKNVFLLEQNFSLSSVIQILGSDPEIPVEKKTLEVLFFDHGKGTEWADTYMFMASDGELPQPPRLQAGFSRTAWYLHYRDSLKAFNELAKTSKDYMRFYSLYNKLFADNGNLQRRFDNLLSWGQYHYEKATGEKPEKHYLQSIEMAQSRREKNLYDQVLELQSQIDQLKRKLDSQNA